MEKQLPESSTHFSVYAEVAGDHSDSRYIHGELVCFFLNSLTVVTDIRLSHPWLLCLLPVSGALFAYLYAYHGGLSSRGNNLVIDQGNGGEEKSRCGLFHLHCLEP